MMELKNKLGKCPSCGEELDMYVRRYDNGYFAVQCLNCLYVGPSCQTASDAMEEWNKISRGSFYPGSDDPTLNGSCERNQCNNVEKTVAATLADRQQDYGDAKESFDRIANLWNIWIAGKTIITPHDVAMMMVLFKVAREKYKTKDDNLVDIGGYAELARRL